MIPRPPEPEKAQLQHVLPLLLAELPAVLDQVRELLREARPEYAEFLDRHQDEVSAAGAVVLSEIVSVPATPLALGGGPLAETPDIISSLFEEIGRVQWHKGNRLTLLLSAYQTGARVAWQQIARVAVEQGVPAAELALLADGLFAFVDQLSSASTRGYLAEQSEAAAGRERARAELADLLLSGRGDQHALDECARRAGWTLPLTAAVVLVDGEDAEALEPLTHVLGADWLPINRADGLGLIVSDPAAPGRRRRLAEQLVNCGAVVGPTVTLARLPGALDMTRKAVRLGRSGVIEGDPVFLDEHLDALIVHQDGQLLSALTETVLRPLAGLPPSSRHRLEETLASWLRHMGDRGAVAEELHIHRQTVRYRLAQLQELFGDALTDPARRMQLTLALAWRPESSGATVQPQELNAPQQRRPS